MLLPVSTYTFVVRSFDTQGNYSPSSQAVQVTIPTSQSTSANCPAPAVNAFTGCYYKSLDLTGTPAVVRTDAQVNFDWFGSPPVPEIASSQFSARWQGQFTFDAGVYVFTAIASDGMRLYIDGETRDLCVAGSAASRVLSTANAHGRCSHDCNGLLRPEWNHGSTSKLAGSRLVGTTLARRGRFSSRESRNYLEISAVVSGLSVSTEESCLLSSD